MPDHSQFNIDRTCPGLWTIIFSSPSINKFDPNTMVELGTLMTKLEAYPFRDRSSFVKRFARASDRCATERLRGIGARSSRAPIQRRKSTAEGDSGRLRATSVRVNGGSAFYLAVGTWR